MDYTDYMNETEDLLLRLRANDFEILFTDNGENVLEWSENLVDSKGIHREFLSEAMACDECVIKVLHIPTQKKRTLFLVYGNSAGELVCDYTSCPELDAVVDAFSDAHCN